MPPLRGPAGSPLLIESADDTPLAWFQVVIRGGSAGDPPGREGFTRQMIELVRRGTRHLDRAALDGAIDSLGASLSAAAGNDAASLSVLCLARHLDRLVELAAEVLAHPRMDADEHEKLLRETRHALDEVRDDDASLAARHFDRSCAPSSPYARSTLGTEASLGRIERQGLVASHARMVVPRNLICGFAGNVTGERASALAGRLLGDLPDLEPPPPPAVDCPQVPTQRRLVLVDKPDRSQAHIRMGHLAPAYGGPDYAALLAVETIFGGSFTSRLMQELRVKRGYTYDASCSLGKTRGPHWLRIGMATANEVSADALRVTVQLYEDLVAHGITQAELDFARDYLIGSLPFQLATPRQRARVAIHEQLLGLPPHHTAQLSREIAALTLADTRAAIDRWLDPGRLCTVVVCTADQLRGELEALPLGPVEITSYDAY
jgi:zinc protease